MSYDALLRKSWSIGDFRVSETEAVRADAADSASILTVRREMEEIAARETWDANSCLVAHREAIMKLAPFVKFREEKFGAVLFETRSEKVYTLSPTGAAVVREVIAGAESANLVAKLKEKFEDPTGKMATEAETFLAQLKDKGLIIE
jgi:hypothetical protein